MLAHKIMVGNPETITPDVLVNEAYDLLKLRGIGHFPVVQDVEDLNVEQRVVGIVSDTDLLPYAPPDDPEYPDELKFIKRKLALRIFVEDAMTPIDRIHNFIFENEKMSSFLHKFYRTNKPALNLLMVVNNSDEKRLVGVITWIDILKNWSASLTDDIRDELKDLRAVDLATELSSIPSIDVDKVDSAAACLHRKGTSVHRHVPIYKKGKLIKLFHFHELVPYAPIDDSRLENPELRRQNLELSDYFDRQSPLNIPDLYSVEQRTISADMPIWTDDGTENVISKYLSETIGKPWKHRLAGLIIESNKGKNLTHFLNPYDIIAWLAKKKAETRNM